MRPITAVAVTLYAFSAVVSGDVINVPGDAGSIQAAIDIAMAGDEIVVAVGTWHELIDLKGKAVTVRSTDPADARVVAATVIDGNGLATVIKCVTGEGPATVLDGLTITGGNGNSGGTVMSGGGMHNDGTSPTVRRCVFTMNAAGFSGGGMLNETADPTVIECAFIANSSGLYGGGIYNRFGSEPTIIDCEFTDNVSTNRGGGVGVSGGRTSITDCRFCKNSTGSGGGGVSVFTGALDLKRCTFSGNSAATVGAAIYALNGGSPSIVDCTFEANTPAASVINVSDDFTFRGPPIGACRIGEGCAAIGAAQCAALGGTFDGADLPCDPDTCAQPCTGDIDGNCVVDVDDLVNVILDFGTNGAANGGDVDGSGVVDVDDIVLVVVAFGDCP